MQGNKLSPRVHEVCSFNGSTLVVSNYLTDEPHVGRGAAGAKWAKISAGAIVGWDEVAGHYSPTVRLSGDDVAAFNDAVETARSRHYAEERTLEGAAVRLRAVAAEHDAKGEGETHAKPIRAFSDALAHVVSRPVCASNLAHALRGHARTFEGTPRRHLVDAFNALADLYNPFSGASKAPSGGHRTPDAMGGAR